MKHIAILLIKLYQWTIKPMLGDVCRFYPSCSHYGLQALQKHGFFKGIWLTAKRLLKCHPWHPGGHDPI